MSERGPRVKDMKINGKNLSFIRIVAVLNRGSNKYFVINFQKIVRV